MKTHELKCWPEDFEAIVRGDKTHEARVNDRGFRVGDELRLLEWKPERSGGCDWKASGANGKYTGRAVTVAVTHVTQNQYGLPSELAIMSIRRSANRAGIVHILEQYPTSAWVSGEVWAQK